MSTVSRVLSLCIISILPCAALAQDKSKDVEITVKFKVFDTNKVDVNLKPAKRAIVYARDRLTLKAFPLAEPKITGPTNGFYEVKVPKGWLIEQLEISIIDGDRDFNPAVLSKVVSSADMLVYPAASKATHPFSLQAYLAQMGSYRILLAQLIEEADPLEADRRRSILRDEFSKQIIEMAKVGERLPNASEEEKRIAGKLANEVLKLYGLPYREEPEALPQPMYILAYPACSPRRCCALLRR